MHTSHATVATDRADRYVKQLVSHLGRKAGVVSDGERQRIRLPSGSCVVWAASGRIELAAEADDEPALRTVEDVVARHLVRFGQRDELHVEWVTDAPTD
jgi:hypothetical protein